MSIYRVTKSQKKGSTFVFEARALFGVGTNQTRPHWGVRLVKRFDLL